MPPHPLITRQRLFILAILIGLTLLFFQRLAFSGMIMGRGDVYTYFYPYWDVRSAAFRAGQFPLWSPNVFMGAPLLANSQLGTFYPPNWLLTPFDAPDAIALSLLAHTLWAMLGVYALTRRRLGLEPVPALLAAALFGLGGYLGGQSEHINQLQALSWIPWLFLVGSPHSAVNSRQSIVGTQYSPLSTRYSVLGTIYLPLSLLLALQLLAGHPQTVFITLVGLAIYAAAVSFQQSVVSQQPQPNPKRSLPFTLRLLTFNLSHLAVCTLLALLLAAPQLVPTLELARLSNRSSGLDPQKALAFSFPPLLIGRGLLPSYDGLLFGEYIAYVGVIGLGLAILGAVSTRYSVLSTRDYSLAPYILLLVLAFLLALGAFNPLNWLLANLPGFSFFRVPARWLALVNFSVAVLAGVGLQSLQTARPPRRVPALVVLVLGGLALSSLLAGQAAEDVIGPAVPTLRTWLGWGLALLILLILLRRAPFVQFSALSFLLFIAAIAELLFASQIMPYNQTVPKDVYTASRFTIRQLQAFADVQTPAGRFLSISPLEFDPGDVGDLKARYAALGMNEFSTRVALVATKMREVIAPNLSLTWGLPGVDGFDGGLLPTGYYSTFTSLLLPAGESATSDGRLREILAQPECRGACIPDQRWLNLTNTRYLIADKTADVVQAGVFYDTTFSLVLENQQSLTIEDILPFQATAIDVLYTCPEAACASPMITLETASQSPVTIDSATEPISVDAFLLTRLPLPEPAVPVRLIVRAANAIRLRAITLVDTRVAVFQQLTLPPWKRVLSSDIKVYENSDVLPRAFVVQAVQSVPDDDTALNLMRDTSFDPAHTALLTGETLPIAPTTTTRSQAVATIIRYTPQQVEVVVQAGDAPGLLVLTDAYYPGWVATVNGKPAPIYRTNIMFRGVAVPPGDSTVLFEYPSVWWQGVPLVAALLWLVALAALLWRKMRAENMGILVGISSK